MSSLKFRAWDNEFKRFSENALKHPIEDINYLTDYEWSQYTGLKDKNEQEIYEGDIIEIYGHKYSVIFEIGSFMLVRCSEKTDMYEQFKNCWNDDVYPLCQLHWENNIEKDILYCLEVIGNIYENSNLLDQN